MLSANAITQDLASAESLSPFAESYEWMSPAEIGRFVATRANPFAARANYVVVVKPLPTMQVIGLSRDASIMAISRHGPPSLPHA